MKLWIKIVIGIAIVLVILSGILLYLSQFHFDFSQDYRSIDGYENIVFKDSKSDQCFRLCAWGLIRTESYPDFQDHREIIGISYDEYQLLVENTGAENIWQVVSSPDGRYILYVERIYSGSGITDDENVFYKVYSVDDGTSTTIYSGYRQFLLVDWK